VPLNVDRARRQLADFHFESLFVEELGWDRYAGQVEVAVDGDTHHLRGVAEKRGMAAFVVESSDDALPDHATRRKIERQAARSVHEHLIVYVDVARTTQVWQWVRREPGRPTACRELHYRSGQSGEALIQRLDAITFTLAEEATLSIVDVTQRARAAFDVERVTRRFYDLFKSEHDAFVGFIRGLERREDVEWYASVMLNRLMFVYFIQKKGFLDGDRDYLRSIQADVGPDQFHSFYRYFLLRLFHEGLGQRGRSSELDALLGRVPYLDGGLFDLHELERENSGIQIPDDAFDRLFEFFDSYQWHLDDRPLRADNDINPDVLGYIFEQYINQKQMGAYYTKEDITDYITANTLIPRLFEKLASSAEFDVRMIGELLAGEPDRYMHSPLLAGIDQELPVEIAVGISDPLQRERWNGAAPPEHALATETWREVIARRERYQALRSKLAAGDVTTSADLIALNLNLRQLAQDLVENCDSPALLLAMYGELESLSVLDPTCGSGAFLFAALNILEPLYEATLERMAAFIIDNQAADQHAAFTSITERVDRHPNRGFYVLKTIVVNNLYGVDIMEEAVEICKLRLFLRLVAQVDRAEHLEPLPDIDFNVRAGNSLVGFASLGELLRELGSKLDLDSSGQRIEEQAGEVDRAFEHFRELQLDDQVVDETLTEAKRALRKQLERLRTKLDTYLAAQYGHNASHPADYEQWRASHLPFHWLVEFHEIMSGRGFDVIIGNPPFVEYAKVRNAYTVRGFDTLACGNLYAYVLERSLELAHGNGRMGMISPLSLACTSRMAPLRVVLSRQDLHLPSFDIRPNGLFEGVTQRLCFVFSGGGVSGDQTWTAGYRRWLAPERPALLPTGHYTKLEDRDDASVPVPKFGLDVEKSIREKLGSGSLEMLVDRGVEPFYVHRIVRYFIKAVDFVPQFINAEGQRGRSEDYKQFCFSLKVKPVVVSLLNSSLFYWYWRAHSDGFHCGYGDVYLFPHERLEGAPIARFQTLTGRLMDALRENSAEREISTKRGTIRYQEFYVKPVKPILDEIDAALAKHFDLSDEEIDFITSYDFKYRFGTDDE
jgi:hypothetical protein